MNGRDAFGLILLGFLLLLLAGSSWVRVWDRALEGTPPPEVVVDTIYARPAPCRQSGQPVPLGNHQKDSTMVILICKKRFAAPTSPTTE